MKITGSGPNSISEKTKAAGVEGAKEKRRPSPTRAPEIETGVSEKVAISGRAKEAAQAKEIAKNAADVDEARVAKLKAAIRNGTYEVDADKIADRLVDEHLSTF